MGLAIQKEPGYSLRTTSLDVVGPENPCGAAISRKRNRLAAFVSSDVSFMADRAGKPQGLPVLHRILSPVSVCHPTLRSWMAVNKPQMERTS